jgi:DNA-binding MurR/RpiR family transcriptional regulator
VRASFGIAFQFRYAYNLIARNGVLFDGIGGFVHDQVEALNPGDLLVAISQTPYSTPTVEAVNAASGRGVEVLALTDSALSPLARHAKHVLLFRSDSISFFPSMIAPLALVELLIAWLAAKGGKGVLRRLAEVEARLAAQRAYWNPAARKSG